MKINKTEDDMLWGPYYEAVLNILGSTGLIIPIGDALHPAADETTVTTVGGEQAAFTYEGAGVDAFAKPPKVIGPGRIPLITFNGTDEEADSPDITYWTRADAAFSLGAWVNLATKESSTILSKMDTGANTREWEFGFDSAGKASLFIYDENDAENDSISVTAQNVQAEDTWVFLVATSSANGIHTEMELYYDGVIEGTPTQADSGNFDICRDTAAKVMLGHSANSATPANLFDGTMLGGPLGPFFTQTVLTVDQILRLYQLGRRIAGI